MRTGLAPQLHELVGGDDSRVTPKEMAAAAAVGDGHVEQAIVRAAEYLGIGIANLVVALHPDLVVLGGGVAQIGDLLFDNVRHTLADRVHMIPTDTVTLKPSKLGTMAGTLGGIALAAQRGMLDGA